MKTLRRSMLIWAMMAFAMAATQAAAQQPNTDLADALLRQAVAAEDQASNSEGADALFEAARLHLESAALRASDDPQAVASIRSAALHLAYDRPTRSAELFAQAAERALAMGDVATAAESYIDAADALVGHGLRTSSASYAKAQTWLSQAATLATSADLSEAERERILKKVGLDRSLLAG